MVDQLYRKCQAFRNQSFVIPQKPLSVLKVGSYSYMWHICVHNINQWTKYSFLLWLSVKFFAKFFSNSVFAIIKHAFWCCMTWRLLFQTNPAMLQKSLRQARVVLTLSPPLKSSAMTRPHSWIISQQVKKTRIPKGNSALSYSQTVETGRRRRRRKGIYLFGAVIEKCSQPEDWARGKKDTVSERKFSSVATTAVRLIYCHSAAVSVLVVLYEPNVAFMRREKSSELFKMCWFHLLQAIQLVF